MNHDQALERAALAKNFVEHPYWALMQRQLVGTIQAETEEMLASDERIPLNRASVAMCRKILQTPYRDIEQGKLALNWYEQAKTRLSREPKTGTGEAGR